MKNLNVLIALFLMTLNFGCSTEVLTGRPGANGHSAVFKLLVADSSMCVAGGSVMSAGVDLNEDATLQPSETTSVLVACNGQQGANGSNGSNGTNGINGTNATPVTIVPLCPGVSNYGTFIEVALCYGGTTLVGVYSANGGFATVLAPGNYSSNAIGSACNLTVQANCVITH